MGSDTVAGVVAANKYYKSEMSGFSIPAMEHSTVTSWGGPEYEGKAFENMLNQNKGAPILACVSDSYDIYDTVLKIWCGSLLPKVKQSGTIVVIRPDSGEPVEVLTRLCKTVEDKAGVVYNSKGFKVFNYFRFIWGDGINEETIRTILAAMEVQGYSASNFAFGMGGALLQQVNRDTQKFAYKCSHVTVDGHSVDVFKDPITDPGKKSKRGMLDLVHRFDKYETIQGHEVPGSCLETIYEHGKLVKTYNLNEVRQRAQAHS
jgi:nicotinamide phosphoribosyltransferase